MEALFDLFTSPFGVRNAIPYSTMRAAGRPTCRGTCRAIWRESDINLLYRRHNPLSSAARPTLYSGAAGGCWLAIMIVVRERRGRSWQKYHGVEFGLVRNAGM